MDADHQDSDRYTRRSFVKRAGLAGVAVGLSPAFLSAASRADAASLRAKAGGTLVIAMNGSSDIKNFNQAIGFDGGAWFLSSSIFSRLTVMDYGPAFDIHPQLAHKWEVNPDATLFTFHLVKNAKFHDGTPVTSADVKMSLEGITKYGGPAASVLSGIGRIETPDPYTVKIVMAKPNAGLLYALSVYPWTPILPKHLYEGTDWTKNPYNLKPIGSGPFKFSELVPGDHVTLVRNDAYFGKKALLDKIGGQFVPDQDTAIQGLQAGQYAALNNPPALGLIAQLRSNSKLEVEAPPGPWLCYCGINTGKGPLKNLAVRQALALGINRAAVAKRATAGVAKTAENPYVSGIAWAYDSSVRYPSFNVKKANAMLDAAGFKRNGGNRFKLNLLTTTAEGFYQDAANVLKDQLRALGISVNIQLVDDATFQTQAPKMQHDLVLYALWIGPDPDQWNALLETVDAKKGTGFRNWFAYNNPKVNKLFSEGVQVSARAKRRKFYSQIQQIVAHDLPYIGLFEAPYSFAHSKHYQGFFSEPGHISYRMDLTGVHQV